MFTTRLYFLCGILIILPQLRLCRSNLRKERAIDFPMQWRPVQMSPSASGLHMIPGGGGSDGHQHLISITNFDGTNKAQLSQIAHHNAQILRHIKRVPGVPVTQYHNPFPIFGTAIGGGAAGAGGSILSTSGSADSHAQPHHLSHHHHHHPYHSGPGGAAASGGAAPPGPGKHFIVQTSNVIVHPQPVPQAAIVSAITSAPLVHAHPNSLLTSSSNMAQTMVPYGHHHKHQYFSAKHPPAFLLGKPAEVSGGSNGAYKFLNAIHPSTTTTASGAKNYATAALIKSAVSIQPIFSSTTSRIPIIRDSTLTPLNFHRHTTVKPHPVVGKLQTHLSIGNRPKSPPSGPSGPHSLDELSAHQSHLISSLAQFGTPNFVRTAGDGQQKLPRPNQGPPFSPLPPIDHIGHYLGKNYANQVRFPSNQQQQQQQQHLQHQQNQFRAQILQQQHHQQQLQHQQQQQQQHQQQQQQAHQQQQQQEQLRQQHQHQLDQQLQQQQQEQHQFQQQQKHQYQKQQQQAAQVAQSNQQQQQSQQEETYYMPPSSNENNHTKPVYEPNQSLEQILRDFDVPFKQMPSFADTQTTRSPNAYLPPSSLPSLSPSHSPSILSPFFQQIHQQKNHELEQAEQHDDRQQQQSHKDIHNDASDGFQPSNPAADLLPHFFISSTFAPSPHVVQIQQTADDFLSHNLSFHHTFPSEAITYHTQHLDIQPHHPQQPPQQQQQHNVPPFTRIEDEFTLNLVPPPSYAKDTSQFRRPQASRGPPSTAFPHLQQQHFNANDAATEHIKALEILNKYNIPAISPLQDANRFAYNSAIANSNNGHQQKNPPSITSSLAPPTPTIAQFHVDSSAAHPTTSLTHFTTEKPNVFRNLNRPAESEYKQHKVMHPSYTGGPKRPTANITNSKPEAVTANPALSPGVATAVTHSFFTIEDAVTLSPQLNHAHRNGAGVRPTANHNQIEASLNRPREEEITEVITMRATSEDDELLQHLDVSSTTRAPMRTKHRRRRPRPSSTSTTERRPEEEANEEEEADELQQHQHNRPNLLEEQGHWETNRFPSNHRETSADPTSSTRPASTTTAQHMSRHRTRTRGGGRPTVTVLQEGGIVLEKPIRSRRPTQRPDEASPTPSRTRATSQSTTAARTTATSAETTENYEEPTTMNLRDNIFLANLKQRRRPPHSTKATTFVSSTPSPTLPTDFHQYGGGRGGLPQQQQTTSAGGYVTEIGEDTFMTTRATKPAGTQQTTHIYGQSLSNNDIQSTFDFEEITLASDIAQTVSTQVTIAPIEQQQDVTDIFTTAAALPVAPPSSSSTTTTTTSTSSNTEPAAPPTNHQTQSTVAAEPPAIEASAAPNHNHRFRHRLRPKDHIKQIAHNEIHASSTADTNSVDEQQQLDDGVTPTKFSVRPVSVRLPIIKTTGSLPIVLDSTTTRTTISVDDSTQQSANKNLRPTGAIQKFDPKNRPRFSVKEYRQRLSSSTQSTPVSSETSSSSSSTTPTSTTRLRYPTRSRVLPDLRIKPTRSSALSEEPAVVAPVSTTSERTDEPFAATTEDSSRKRFIPKERRNKSTASNEVFSSSERSNSFGLTTPSTTSSRGSTLATTPRTTRTRSPSTSRRAFSSTSTTTASPTVTVTRTPTIRKFPGGPSLRRPSQPSLRQRIALSQQKKSSTEATMAASTLVSLTAMQPQTTTPGSINKLFNVDESDNGFTPDVDNLSVDDIDMSDSVNTENYKLETAIMKIAKDDHSYRPYAHSNITPRTRSRTSSTSSTTESLFFVNDDDAAENQLSGDVDVDMNGSPSEQSERVADLTRFGTNHFQSVNTAAGSATSRRIPGYFTLATEDPILPIEAFFPKMSNGMRG